MRKPRLPIFQAVLYFNMSKPYKNYSGIKVDYLTFKARVEDLKRNKWVLSCNCGKEVIKRPDHIFDKKNFKSCGCLPRKKSKTNNEVCINRIFTSYKNGAKRRGFIFEVDIEYFSIILIKNCHYCGIEPLQKIKVKDNFFLYNGIDRKNSSLGYVKNNLLPCCFICNRGKSNMNYKDFKKHLLRITDFNNNLKK